MADFFSGLILSFFALAAFFIGLISAPDLASFFASLDFSRDARFLCMTFFLAARSNSRYAASIFSLVSVALLSMANLAPLRADLIFARVKSFTDFL